MPKITIETIKHKNQRYNTVGDWTYDHDGNVEIRISEELEIPSFFLVAVHELIEVIGCWGHFISTKDVDDWDLAHPKAVEPGSLPECPYGPQHSLAEAIERILAVHLDYDWDSHEKGVYNCTSSSSELESESS